MSKAAAIKGKESSSILEMPLTAFLYYAAFGLYSIMAGISHSTISAPAADLLIEVAVLSLLLLKMFIERANPERWLLALVIVAIGFIAWRQSAEGWLFWGFLFIVCGNGVDIKKLAIVAFVTSLLVIVGVVAACHMGLAENITTIRKETAYVRNSLGFNHPNTFAFYVLLCATAFVVCRFDKSLLTNICVLMVAAMICLLIADSRTSAMLAAFQAFMLVLFRLLKSPNARYRVTNCMLIAVVAIALVSLFMVVAYDATNPVHKYLDDLTNMRFYWAHRNYLNSSITLFGDSFSGAPVLFYRNGEPKTFYVDNAYAHLLIRYGLIPTIVFVYFYGAAIRKAALSGKWDVVLFGLFIFAIYGIEETYALQFECNFFLASIASLIYEPSKAAKREKIKAGSKASQSVNNARLFDAGASNNEC